MDRNYQTPTLTGQLGWSASDQQAAKRQGWVLDYVRVWPWTERGRYHVFIIPSSIKPFETNEDAARYVEEHAESDPLCARAWALVVEDKVVGCVDRREP